MDLKQKIRLVPDFPKPGIVFQDITTLLKDKEAFHEVIRLFYEKFKDYGIDYVAAIESRGYLLGAPLAYELGCGLVVIRKPGKLPAPTLKVEYDLEYGSDVLEVHKDAVEPGRKVLLVDDLLATGGTVAAAEWLISQLGGRVVSVAFVVELEELGGRRQLLPQTECFSLIRA